MRKNSPWTPKKVEILKALWSDNSLSASDIGVKLDVSKNAVISKARTLELKPRGKTKKYNRAVIIRPHFKHLADLPEGSCKFVNNDGFFCGKKAIKRQSYCKTHKKIMYLTPKDLEKIKIGSRLNNTS